jgi:hypothetical protein
LPWLVPAPLGIVRFSVTVPSFDQIDIALRRLDALLGLPLEAVQHIDDCLEMRGVDGPVSVTIKILDQLDDPTAEAFEDLRRRRVRPGLGEVVASYPPI